MNIYRYLCFFFLLKNHLKNLLKTSLKNNSCAISPATTLPGVCGFETPFNASFSFGPMGMYPDMLGMPQNPAVLAAQLQAQTAMYIAFGYGASGIGIKENFGKRLFEFWHLYISG